MTQILDVAFRDAVKLVYLTERPREFKVGATPQLGILQFRPRCNQVQRRHSSRGKDARSYRHRWKILASKQKTSFEKGNWKSFYTAPEVFVPHISSAAGTGKIVVWSYALDSLSSLQKHFIDIYIKKSQMQAGLRFLSKGLLA